MVWEYHHFYLSVKAALTILDVVISAQMLNALTTLQKLSGALSTTEECITVQNNSSTYYQLSC